MAMNNLVLFLIDNNVHGFDKFSMFTKTRCIQMLV